ncbi:MAG: TIGR03067 domain-containing protein [Planctomycetota bacterium]
MSSKLPARPHLDHLRRQAKALLADLAAGHAAAIETIRTHLPAAKKWSAERIAKSGLRLADAQSAIARQSGFAAWPHLARHVETLRALEGTWAFERLTVDGQDVPAAMTGTSRVLIDGDRFRTEAPEGVYEGIFNLDVEAEPHAIDIEFVEGPEAGHWNYGIFRLDGDRLELCLDVNGKPRPAEFRAPAGSRHAHEVLRRVVRTRPEKVEGGVASPREAAAAGSARVPYVPSPTLTRLQGAWSAVRLVRDGMEVPAAALKTASRTAKENEVEIVVGGKVAVHAFVRLDETATPMRVEYHNVGGLAKGTVQHGLFRWDGDDACFCIAPPGAPAPDGFDAPKGSGRSFSQWRRKPASARG